MGSIAFRASSWARRVASSAARLCDNGLAVHHRRFALRRLAQRIVTLGLRALHRRPGLHLDDPGALHGARAASAASARSIVPIGVAARSKRSSTLADPADVTEEDPTAPAPALAPAPGGRAGGRRRSASGWGVEFERGRRLSGGRGLHRGVVVRDAEEGGQSSTSCSASDWNGGRPAATTTRARARSGATRPSVDARGGWGAGRPATAAMDAPGRARRTASCFLSAPGASDSPTRSTRREGGLRERA